MKLSVIIPVGFKEEQLKPLLEDFKLLPKDSEILFVTPEPDNVEDIEVGSNGLIIRKIISSSGRANSMNLGADESKGEFLWFLHADSKLDSDTITSLCETIYNRPKDLLYFNLAFYDGPKLMKLNEWGVRFRTYFLKTPFGDQGFCVRRDIFEQIGRYQTKVIYGEDHLFVIEARRKKIPITRINAKIYTSGRKYAKNGWLKTTLTHLYLWRHQAYSDYQQVRRAKI